MRELVLELVTLGFVAGSRWSLLTIAWRGLTRQNSRVVSSSVPNGRDRVG